MNSTTLGLFDSGVGGLTVLNVLQKKFNHWDYIYLGDTARLPYGTKSSNTVKKYAEQIIQFLLKQKVTAVVSACHSASSAILEHNLKAAVPLWNVISPACESAVGVSQTGRIGVLATQATVNGNIYPTYMKKLNPKVEVFQMPAPLLVPLVESGWIEDPITNLIVMRYCEILKQQNIDTLIMACTHYPVLRKAIQRAFGSQVQLIDPAESLALQLEKEGYIKNSEPSQNKFYFTDASENFLINAKQILNLSSYPQIEHVDLVNH